MSLNNVLITGDLTVNGSIEIQECPIIQSNVVSAEVFVNLGVVTFPYDDTIPQNTEGGEIMSCSITPTRDDSILEIEYNAPTSGVNVDEPLIAALFRDSTANALKTVMYKSNPTLFWTTPTNVYLKHWVTSGSTSTTTFKIRTGKPSTAGTELTGIGKNQYGGTLTYTLRVSEILNVSGNFVE